MKTLGMTAVYSRFGIRSYGHCTHRAAWGLLTAMLVGFVAFVPLPARAQNCDQLATGIIVGYYLNSNDELVAAEGMRGDVRKPVKKANVDVATVLVKNWNREIPDNASNGSVVNINTLGAKTAIYLQFVQDDENPKGHVCTEDVSSGQGTISRSITTATKIKPLAGGVCTCQLVWCGRYKCCPC